MFRTDRRRGSAVTRRLMNFLIACQMVLAVPAGAELLDRIIAAVNNDVIAQSDLRQAMEFNSILSRNGGGGRKLEAETLEGLINRRLLLQEAYRLRYAEVSDQEAAAETAKLKERLGSDQAFREFLSRTALTEAKLERMLGERLLVERFVEKKIGLYARVSRDEAEQYYKDHAAAFSGKRFAEVQKQISAFLAAEKTGQQVDQYLTDLRARADIRMNPLGD